MSHVFVLGITNKDDDLNYVMDAIAGTAFDYWDPVEEDTAVDGVALGSIKTVQDAYDAGVDKLCKVCVGICVPYRIYDDPMNLYTPEQLQILFEKVLDYWQTDDQCRVFDVHI